MTDFDFFLAAVAIVTIGVFLLLPKGYRHAAVLVPLLVVFVAVMWNIVEMWGFSFKLLGLMLIGILMAAARVWVGRRM